MKKLLYTFLLGALMVHIIPLEANSRNYNRKSSRRKSHRSIQKKNKKKKRDGNIISVPTRILCLIIVVCTGFVISENLWQASPVEKYKEWTEEKATGMVILNHEKMRSLVKKETKHKDYSRWRDWINIRNNKMINQLAKIYMDGNFDISFLPDPKIDMSSSAIDFLISCLEQGTLTSVEAAYLVGQTLYSLDNFGRETKKKCIHYKNDELLERVILKHGSKKIINGKGLLKDAEPEMEDPNEKHNTIPLITVLLNHGANPETETNGNTYIKFAETRGLTIAKNNKGKWEVFPK